MTSQSEAWPPGKGIPLDATGQLFHLPQSLRAYGDFSTYDLSDEVGLIKYVVDFVNRKPEPYAHGTTQILPVGRERLQKLLHLAVHGPAGAEEMDLSDPNDEAMDEIRGLFAGSHREARLERTAHGAGWRNHVFINNADQFYALIATLLMNADLRAKVAQCRRASCSEFFIVERSVKGRPQLYHNDTCTKLANAGNADERQRNLRKRRAVIKRLSEETASKSKVESAVKQAFREHSDASENELYKYAKRIVRRGKYP